MVESYTVADFFCGAGGFSEGFNQEGFKIVFSLDNWKPAKITHDFNFPDCDCKLMNILELDTPEKIDEIIPDTDIIIGSPPCVSFSNSNIAKLGILLFWGVLGTLEISIMRLYLDVPLPLRPKMLAVNAHLYRLLSPQK